MNAPLSPAVILDLIKREKERRLAQKSLMAFTRQSFHLIEPGQEFVSNWHLDVIAEHLEAVTSGDIRNLVINIPPGCMKSILTSVAWPAWEWANDPSIRWLSASYGVELAIRDAIKSLRRLRFRYQGGSTPGRVRWAGARVPRCWASARRSVR